MFKHLKETYAPALRTADFNILLNAILTLTIDQKEGFFGTLVGATEALQRILKLARDKNLPDFKRQGSVDRIIGRNA